jgi:hypothetical protein
LYSSSFLKKSNSLPKACIVLALIVIVSYSPVIFLNQTYDSYFPIPPKLLGFEGKKNVINVIDPAADFIAVRPGIILATEMMKEGTIPLWNPYMGGGNPLATDTINYVFSPTILLFMIPVDYWDFGLLTLLWLAGFFTFLFLRSMKLNFTSSIAGATFYMLSGVFTWHLAHPHIPVIIFTPLILYSVEMLFQTRSPKYVILTSVSLCFGILGAHLESVILQFLFIVSYFFYRLIFPIFLKYYLKYKNKVLNDDFNKQIYNTKKILTWSIIALILGVGLSAFFIIPVYEHVTISDLSAHDPGYGLNYWKKLVIAFAFVPYVMGPILHGYWSLEMPNQWASAWGFSGVFSLFFSVTAIILFLKNKTKDTIHKYTPLFFIGISVFFMMKTFGVPIVNLIGALPVFDVIAFPRYSGTFIPFGFAIAAAFGIQWLSTINVKRTIPIISCLIVILILVMVSIPFFTFLSEDAKFNPLVTRDDAIHYVMFQFLLAGLFVIAALLVSLSILKNRSVNIAIIPIIILELSLFIPMGLDKWSMFYKSIITLIGMGIISILALFPNKISWNYKTKKLKLSGISLILVVTTFGFIIISEQSPQGIADRFDYHQENKLTVFLKENLENHRMFSLDFTLGPNHPSAYQINSISIFTPFITDWFALFNENFLQPKPWNQNLGYPPFSHQYGPDSYKIYLDNKYYYDFLGVKYLVTAQKVDSTILKPVHKFGSTVVYESEQVFPRVFLVNEFKIMNSFNDAQKTIKDNDIDLRKTVILEGQLSQKEIESLTLSTIDENKQPKITLYSPNKVIIETSNESSSLLVLTDTYFPGWHAYVDGEKTTIYRADGLVRSIFIPPGAHSVTFSYLPESLVHGTIISIFSGVSLGVILLYYKIKYKKNN